MTSAVVSSSHTSTHTHARAHGPCVSTIYNKSLVDVLVIACVLKLINVGGTISDSGEDDEDDDEMKSQNLIFVVKNFVGPFVERTASFIWIPTTTTTSHKQNILIDALECSGCRSKPFGRRIAAPKMSWTTHTYNENFSRNSETKGPIEPNTIYI